MIENLTSATPLRSGSGEKACAQLCIKESTWGLSCIVMLLLLCYCFFVISCIIDSLSTSRDWPCLELMLRHQYSERSPCWSTHLKNLSDKPAIVKFNLHWCICLSSIEIELRRGGGPTVISSWQSSSFITNAMIPADEKVSHSSWRKSPGRSGWTKSSCGFSQLRSAAWSWLSFAWERWECAWEWRSWCPHLLLIALMAWLGPSS